MPRLEIPRAAALVALLFSCLACSAQEPRFVDLSLLIAPEYPCTWPTHNWPKFQLNRYREIGPLSPYNIDVLTIDPNTGTQMDTPPHSIPLPDSGLEFAGPAGTLFTEKIPAWQFGGEACVIDVRDLLDKAPNGHSPLIHTERVKEWEKKNRSLRFGDVAIFRSGYSDKYYKPYPAGSRFIADAMDKKTPGYPDPHPTCLEYVGSKKVMLMATDSPSMGTLPDLVNITHVAGLKHGGIFTEGATGLGALPTTGAFYCMLSPKHVGGAYAECRALAVVGDPLARQLIESARNKQAVDLSVPMSLDFPVWWPGTGIASGRQAYFRVNFDYSATLNYYHHTHLLDSHTGTHVVPPSYALPEPGFDNGSYSDEVRGWLDDYEKKYGARGTSTVTAEAIPLSQTCGWARVIDVSNLVGSSKKDAWPHSPEITVIDVKKYEAKTGPLKAGEIVIFHSGHTDKYFKPFPEGTACLSDPINGRSEGWPAPGPDVIVYLASKGIRCVATDGPTLGGVDPRKALTTYWTLGSKGMVGVEYLINVGDLPERAFFLFATPKIRDCHGGPGRAIALY